MPARSLDEIQQVITTFQRNGFRTVDWPRVVRALDDLELLREDAHGFEAKRTENYANRLAEMEIKNFMDFFVRPHGNSVDAVDSLYTFLWQLGARDFIDPGSMMMIECEYVEYQLGQGLW